MTRFAYPNVNSLKEGKFLGCGRYFSADAENAPAENCGIVELNIPSKSEVNLAVLKLAPESVESKKVVYETRDAADQAYKGESLDLAYVLTAVGRTRPIKQKIHSFSGDRDVWATGAIDIKNNDHPFLKAVDQKGFDLKLKAFLSDDNPDRVFLVPAANIEPRHEAMFPGHEAEVISLAAFIARVKKGAAEKKTVIRVPENELEKLVDCLFDQPETLRRKKAGRWAVAIAVMLALAGMGWGYFYWTPPPLSEQLIASLEQGRFQEAVELSERASPKDDQTQSIIAAMNRPSPLMVRLQYQRPDRPPSKAFPLGSPFLEDLCLSHEDNYRLIIDSKPTRERFYIYAYQLDWRGQVQRHFPNPVQQQVENPVAGSETPLQIPPGEDNWLYLDELSEADADVPFNETLILIGAPWPACDIEALYAEIQRIANREDREKLLADFRKKMASRKEAGTPAVFFRQFSFRHESGGAALE